MNIFNKYPFLIAEIGFDFYNLAEKYDMSDMDAARYMIDEAQQCGVDAVNFQLFNKFSAEEYRELADYCRKIGITFMSTPFDFESADYLDEFMDIYRISSSDIINIPFIKYVASKNKPILLSTGASTLNEVKHAVNAIEEVSTVDIAIMHSVLSYPTAYEDANLLMIKDLAENFPQYEIGYSDHTEVDENMAVLTTAYNYGAGILEKHFTIDKTLPGTGYAMDPGDVVKFRWNVNFLSKLNGRKNKHPLICESSSRRQVRKSIVSKRDIKQGEVISDNDLIFKCPGTGIYPSEIDSVVGKTARVDISKYSILDFDMID